MATFAWALACVKEDLAAYLPPEMIEQACRDAGHQWRKRKLDPVATLHLFILQILWANTSMTHLRHLAKVDVKPPAYCRARQRLPLAALKQLLPRVAQSIAGPQGQTHWCGLRTHLVDATCALAPDTPDTQRHFPQPKGQKKGCGFPIPKLVGLFDPYSGLVRDVNFTPLYRHDLRGAMTLHEHLGPGDLLVGDRAFCGYAHLALLTRRQVHGLFRMHASRKVSFRVQGRARKRPRRHNRLIRSLGPGDQVVAWRKPRGRPTWMSAQEFEALAEEQEIREVRFKIPCASGRTRSVVIATTLLDPVAYPKEKIAELYGLRWRIETHFAQLKTTLQMRRIKCQSHQGVQKEMLVYALVYNLVHALMQQAATRQNTAAHRISFIDTIRWMLARSPGEPMPLLLLNPRRTGRHQPRVVKDRHDGYQRMTVPRSIMNKKPGNWPGRK